MKKDVLKEHMTEDDSLLATLTNKARHLYRVGQVKLFNLLLVSQVLSQFVSISDNTGSASAIPEPAAGLVQTIAVTNLDLAGFVPVGCVFRNTNMHHVLLFKVVSPLVVVALLWMVPLWRYLRRESHAEAWQSAARFSLLFLELVLPMISTTIANVFQCTNFDDGSYLQIELTLPCDDSAQRRSWVAVASVSLVAYPLGTFEDANTARASYTL